MLDPRTPVEAFNRALMRVLFFTPRRKGRPGEIIEGLPEADRTLLRDLRSDDLGPNKVPSWHCVESEAVRNRNYFSEELLKFDREVLRLSR